jgi:hypothetical protein
LSVLIKLKRGLSSEWSQLNPVLKLGEPGYEKDTKKLKIGDGVTLWNDLPYIGSGAIDFEDVQDEVANFLKAGNNIVLNYDDPNNILTISTSGLQPTGNYSIEGHSHIVNNITDFDSIVGGLIQDNFNTNLVAGNGINFTYNEPDLIINTSGLNFTTITNLGSISGTVNIDYGEDRQIQTLSLNGTSTTFSKGSGWPSTSGISVDVVLKITVSSETSITWNIVNEWYNQPPFGSLANGTHLFLLRSMGNSIIEGHYIGNKTN